MRVLHISSDRSRLGGFAEDTIASQRQQAYAKAFGELDDIGFTLQKDDFSPIVNGPRRTYPTHSRVRAAYLIDALRIARTLPRPDVVSAQDPFECGLTAWLIARFFGVPLHVQVHTDFLSPEYLRHSALNRWRVKLATSMLKRAVRIRVVSERIKHSLEARYGLHAPVTVLPIFIDTEHFRFALPDPALEERFSRFAHTLLVVARLEREKNIQLALESFDEYAPESASLIIVGDGSLRDDLETFAGTLKAKERIFFEGAKDPAAYYKMADLVLCTSQYEGYGLAIGEALAAGTPVLSTDVGAARELGAIVADPHGFGEKLVEWFRSGPREAHLRDYPYQNFDQYVYAYRDDIAACVEAPKTQY